MRDVADERVFQNVREWPMTHVVKENGSLQRLCLTVKDEDALLRQREDSLAHQVESTQRMLEPGVLCPGINYRSHTELLDARETLEQAVLHDIEQQATRNAYEPEYRVVDYFEVVHCVQSYGKLGEYPNIFPPFCPFSLSITAFLLFLSPHLNAFRR